MRYLCPLVLAIALVACDSDSVSPPPLMAPTVVASASASENAFAITNSVQIATGDETVLLMIDDDAFELSASVAYFLGEALNRAGFGLLDPELAGELGRGGDKCSQPAPGQYVYRVESRAYAFGGGEGCPPPPPPPFLREPPGDLFPDIPEWIEVPEGLEWTELPSGFVAEL